MKDISNFNFHSRCKLLHDHAQEYTYSRQVKLVKKSGIETWILEDEFKGSFSLYYFFYCQFSTLSKDSRSAWSLLRTNVG